MKSIDALPPKVERRHCVRCGASMPASLLRSAGALYGGGDVCKNEIACRRRERQRPGAHAKARTTDAR